MNENLDESRVPVAHGKYVVTQQPDGRVVVERGDDKGWRDCTGDKLILCLAQDLHSEREKNQRALKDLEWLVWYAELFGSTAYPDSELLRAKETMRLLRQ